MFWFVSKFSDKSISFKRPADEAFPVNQVDNIMTRSTLFQEWLRKDFREIHEIHGTGTETDCMCIAQKLIRQQQQRVDDNVKCTFLKQVH